MIKVRNLKDALEYLPDDAIIDLDFLEETTKLVSDGVTGNVLGAALRAYWHDFM